MKLKTLVVSLVLGTGLAGCDLPSQPIHAPANWISVPALPIIQDAVISLAPTFNGQRNPLLIGQVCALAREQVSQDQVNAQLAKLGIDASKLPQKSADAVALLVNGDPAAQATACAAYQASAVLSPINPGDFLKPEVADEAAKTAGKSSTLQVDNARLAKVMPIRIAQARATTDVFALIASQLQQTPGLSVAEYRDKARQLFGQLAPTYLERVQQQMPPAGAKYQLLRMDDEHFAFSNDVGTGYDYSVGNGLVLTQNGQLWYGKGRLLDNVYRLQSAYFKEEVAQLLAPAKH